MTITLANIEQALHNAFNPTKLIVKDRSVEHKHHSGWKEGYITHIDVIIVSEKFHNQSKVQRHRFVYSALACFFREGLHSASIVAMVKNAS